ncbi:MAG: mechanosensitive ion channel family protein, partial [Chloroflexota bacterium]
IIIGIGVLISLTVAIPTFQPSELFQLLGIGGIAIGFAFQNIFQNFLAGIILLIDQPFGIGDEIIAKDYEGRVEDIQLRATTLRTYDGRRVVIPNSDLFTDSVVVNTAFGYRRSEYDIGIGYEDDIERAQEIMLSVMRETEGVLDNPAPDTVMMEMGDSAIIIRARWWSRPRKAVVMHTQSNVLRSIKNQLTEEGFNIPFPIRTVMFYDQSEPGVQGETVDMAKVETARRSA